jgi:hypothetical protein
VKITLSDEERTVDIVQGDNGSILSGSLPTPVTATRSLVGLVPDMQKLLAKTLFTLEGATKITVDADGQRTEAVLVDGAWEQSWAEQLMVARVDRAMKVGVEGDGSTPWAIIAVSAADGREQQLHVRKLNGEQGLAAADIEGGVLYTLPPELASIVSPR